MTRVTDEQWEAFMSDLRGKSGGLVTKHSEDVRERGWGLSRRPDRVQNLLDVGFWMAWGCPERGEPEQSKLRWNEIKETGWTARWDHNRITKAGRSCIHHHNYTPSPSPA